MALINRHTSRVFHRIVYASILKTITLLKRGDDQQEGTVTAITLYQCRRSSIQKEGEPLQGDMSDNHTCTWFIPRVELDRVGVAYINNLDRIIEKTDADSGPSYNLQNWWQVESGDPIDVKLFETRIRLSCRRIDPPGLNGAVNPFLGNP